MSELKNKIRIFDVDKDKVSNIVDKYKEYVEPSSSKSEFFTYSNYIIGCSGRDVTADNLHGLDPALNSYCQEPQVTQYFKYGLSKLMQIYVRYSSPETLDEYYKFCYTLTEFLESPLIFTPIVNSINTNSDSQQNISLDNTVAESDSGSASSSRLTPLYDSEKSNHNVVSNVISEYKILEDMRASYIRDRIRYRILSLSKLYNINRL